MCGAEASKAQVTSKKRAKRKARKKKAQKVLEAEELAASSDEEEAPATPPSAAAVAPAGRSGGTVEGPATTLDTRAANAAAVAAISQSSAPVEPEDSPLLAMLGTLDGPVEEQWQQVRVRSQKHAHGGAVKGREGSGRSDSSRAHTATSSHGAPSDSNRGGRRGRTAGQSRGHPAECPGSGAVDRKAADAAAAPRSSPQRSARPPPSQLRALTGPYDLGPAASASAAVGLSGEGAAAEVPVRAWGAEEWPELPAVPAPGGSHVTDQTYVSATAGGAGGPRKPHAAAAAAPPRALHMHADMGVPLELLPRLDPAGLDSGTLPRLSPAVDGAGGLGPEPGRSFLTELPPSSAGLAAMPGWSSFGLAGLDSMPQGLGAALPTVPSMPPGAKPPRRQPGSAPGEAVWAPLQGGSAWPEAPLSGPVPPHPAADAVPGLSGLPGVHLGAMPALHLPPAKSLGARVSEALNGMQGRLAGDLQLQPDFESIVRQAGIEDDDGPPRGGIQGSSPVLGVAEGAGVPEWAGPDLPHTSLGTLTGGRFSMF